MAETLANIWKYHLGAAIAMIFFLVLGILHLGAGYAVGTSWCYSPIPAEQSFRLYITPQAEVIPAIEFRPGLPRIEVSMEEFIRQSQGQPYIVSFWSGWINGEQGWRNSMFSVSYSLSTKSATSERYLYATQRIPNYSEATALGYWTKTVYDATKKEFFLVVTGTHYGMLAAVVALTIIGAFFIFLGCGFGFELWESLSRLPRHS
ncbi:MAG: hypothetical protein AAB449_01425 [Patescibacteria group bacterium]